MLAGKIMIDVPYFVFWTSNFKQSWRPPFNFVLFFHKNFSLTESYKSDCGEISFSCERIFLSAQFNNVHKTVHYFLYLMVICNDGTWNQEKVEEDAL